MPDIKVGDIVAASCDSSYNGRYPAEVVAVLPERATALGDALVIFMDSSNIAGWHFENCITLAKKPDLDTLAAEIVETVRCGDDDVVAAVKQALTDYRNV